jgi:hypothetical protein
MKQFDKLIFGLIFGFSFPLLFLLLFFTLWYYFFQEIHPLYFLLTGLITGILADIFYLKKVVTITLLLPAWSLVGIYLFHNILIYGMFMGFPVFNLIMGILAGYYYGVKINYNSLPSVQIESLKNRVPLFTGFIMFLICVSSALIALSEKTIGLELQNMLGLSFYVTKGMVISIIVFGGATLIVAQYFLTKIVMIKSIKFKNNALTH